MTMPLKAMLLLAGFALAFGCDSDENPSVPGLAVHLYGPSGASDPFAGVGWMRMVLSGDGLATPFIQTLRYEAGGSAELTGVPFSAPGQRRRLVVEGLSDAGGQPGFIISRGRSPSVEVQAGAPLQEFDVLFSKVNTFFQAISTSTLAVQRLATPRVGHAVTMTPSEAVITGGGTFTAANSQWWLGTGFTTVHTSVEAMNIGTRELGPRTNLLFGRTWHTGTALPSGQVILAGGYGADGAPTATVELYNPPGILEGRAIGLLPLAVPRAGHTATLLDENTRVVLFIGGDANDTWELWDPESGSRGIQQLPDGLARRHHQATTFFVPGRTEPAVLVTGGESAVTVHLTAMLFDSVSGNLIPLAQAMPGGARTQHAAVYVPDRNFIYVSGGFGDPQRGTTVPGIDVFDIGQTRFIEGQSGFRMRSGRGGHAATLLADNLVFMAGGLGEEPPGTGLRPLGSLEVIYEFIDTQSLTLRIEVASSWNPNGVGQVPYLPSDRIGHRVVALDGTALIIGGATFESSSTSFRAIPELWLYNPQ